MAAAKSCLICTEESDVWGRLECGHDGVCWKCCLKSRFKNDDPAKAKLCQECQIPSETLYLFSSSPGKVGEEGTEVVDPQWGVKCATADILQELKYLRDLYCPLYFDCGKNHPMRSVHDLNAHLASVHGVSLCVTCFSSRPLFPSEHTLYTEAEVKKHRSTTERCHKDESNFYGHPECYFCRSRHFDTEALYHHMRRKHVLCDICERSPGRKRLVFYPTLRELQQHWRQEHYYCQQCHELHNGRPDHHPTEWVFATKLDYNSHQASVHGVQQGATGRRGGRVDQVELGFGTISYGEQSRARRGGGYAGGSVRDEEHSPGDNAAITFQFPKGRTEVVSLGLPTQGHGRGARRRQRRPSPQPQGANDDAASFPPLQPPSSSAFEELWSGVVGARFTALPSQDKVSLQQASSEFAAGTLQSSGYYAKLCKVFGEDVLSSDPTLFQRVADLVSHPDQKAALQLVHATAVSRDKGVREPQVQGGKKGGKGDSRNASPPPQASWSDRVAAAASSSSSSSSPASAKKPPAASDTAAFPDLRTAHRSRKSPQLKPAPKAAAASGVWGQRGTWGLE